LGLSREDSTLASTYHFLISNENRASESDGAIAVGGCCKIRPQCDHLGRVPEPVVDMHRVKMVGVAADFGRVSPFYSLGLALIVYRVSIGGVGGIDIVPFRDERPRKQAPLRRLVGRWGEVNRSTCRQHVCCCVVCCEAAEDGREPSRSGLAAGFESHAAFNRVVPRHPLT
jgi:hypothetical protein